VDELSRLRHSHLSGYQVRPTDADLDYFIGLKKDPLQTSRAVEKEKRRLQQFAESPSPTKPSSRRGSDVSEAMSDMSARRLRRTLSEEEEEEDDFSDLKTLTLYVLIVELVLFLRWCAGVCFIYPGFLKPV